MIIDSHVHLDIKRYADPVKAGDILVREMDECGIDCSWVIELPAKGVDIQDILSLKQKYNNRFEVFAYLNPRDDNIDDLVIKLVSTGISGFKFHPRLQRFSLRDELFIKTLENINHYRLPVIIDCFPDGQAIANEGFGAVLLGGLAESFSDINFIAAHAGGHYVLDFMMLAKSYKNVFLDISFSLLYYNGSSVPGNIAYALKNLKGEKILYGSDYPNMPLGISLRDSISLLDHHGIDKSYIERMLGDNAKDALSV